MCGRSWDMNASILGCAAWAPEATRWTPLVVIACCQSASGTAATRAAHLSWLAWTFCAQTAFWRAAAWPGAVVTPWTPRLIRSVDAARRWAQAAAASWAVGSAMTRLLRLLGPGG